jgi:hypothetical protein
LSRDSEGLGAIDTRRKLRDATLAANRLGRIAAEPSERDDAIPDRNSFDIGTNCIHESGALVAKHGGKRRSILVHPDSSHAVGEIESKRLHRDPYFISYRL